ncbi:ABC transporter permease [Sinomonas atrocyanea]|uniref:ABC transporter permease n=1 Tax=Sinomonas atrocyanea TaxID=37927 RepID=UPI00277E6752|nr:ABC transporter permease [Sinomonas atrocyanea]MDQ0259383.1 simple sugar transport system permease protein [Sinomonas atrocyanea]MDR6621212.1 simple sugar transport system permease protein [Sinomonas atrocyanea]
MSTTAAAPAPQDARPGPAAAPVSRKAPIGLSLLAVAGTVLFGALSGSKSASFGLVDAGREASGLAAWLALAVALVAAAWFGYLRFRGTRSGRAPARWTTGALAAAAVVFLLALLGVAGVTVITVSSPVVGWLASAVMLAGAAYSVWLTSARRTTPGWVGAVFAVAFLVGFLVWIVAGGRDQTPFISLAGLLAGAVTLSVPLVFGSLSGVLCERSGIVNIAIEGQLLMGAFSAAVGATLAHNVYVGLVAAAVAGALVSLVLALVSIKYLVNQIIVGVVLNVLVVGLTNFLFSTLLTEDPDGLNKPPHLGNIEIPILADVPVIGPILFRQSLVGYLMYIAVVVVYVGLFHTRWGLRVRAVGEHPQAADTLGVNVNRTRFWNTILGGAVAGIGGSFFTLVAVDAFSKEMSAGRGYIALAALIFGRWNPIGAFLASLLFGFADNLQSIITIIGSPVPSQFMAMLPYVVTVFAVAGLVGRSRPPAMEGIPYVKQ